MSSLTDKQKSFVEEIKVSGEHLLHLIDELLDLSRIESGRLAILLTTVDITSAVHQAAKLVQPLIIENNLDIDIQCNCSCMVIADDTRLKQVLVNLLSNAAKYNRPGGHIQVNCELQDGHKTRISVTDTGLGIREDQVPDLFKAFERLDAKFSGIDGTGIGLSLSKQLMEQMGGAIGVESTPGKGSTFWIELPLAEAKGIDIKATEIDTAKPCDGHCKVLYIEDNSANLKVVESLLGVYPEFQLLTANSGHQGYQLALRFIPDVILLDIHLPDMDGYQVFRTLVSRPETAHIPVIALSADAMPFDVQKGLDRGFRDYLTKPVDLQQLLKVLKQHCGSSTSNCNTSSSLRAQQKGD
jgi:CheY-like chemotaxis protein